MQPEKLPEPNWKQVIKDFYQIKLISGERLSDKNVSGFWMLVVPWNVYILVVMIFLATSQAAAEKRLLGMCLLLAVIGGDWVILSQKLLDKYIGKMGEGKAVVKFWGVFRNI